MIRLLFLTSVPLLLAFGLLLGGAINPPASQATADGQGTILHCRSWSISEQGERWRIICIP